MKVYRISICNFIDDVSGFGSFLYGGRWNSKGVHMLYTSSTSSLAMLEIIAHGIVLNENYCLLILDLPEDKIKVMQHQELPPDWFVHPAPDQLKKIGDAFISENKYLALSIPSAVNRQERNILINPKHMDFKKVMAIGKDKVLFDKRVANIPTEQ